MWCKKKGSDKTAQFQNTILHVALHVYRRISTNLTFEMCFATNRQRQIWHMQYWRQYWLCILQVVKLFFKQQARPHVHCSQEVWVAWMSSFFLFSFFLCFNFFWGGEGRNTLSEMYFFIHVCTCTWHLIGKAHVNQFLFLCLQTTCTCDVLYQNILSVKSGKKCSHGIANARLEHQNGCTWYTMYCITLYVNTMDGDLQSFQNLHHFKRHSLFFILHVYNVCLFTCKWEINRKWIPIEMAFKVSMYTHFW